MIIEDHIIRAYLQAAVDRGGSYHMAMSMMVNRILVLEDRLLRAGVPFDEDKIVGAMMPVQERLETRPKDCRFRLADENKPYPRSSCQACGKTVMTGLGKKCSWDKSAT
jgi:hypothetical protein